MDKDKYYYSLINFNKLKNNFNTIILINIVL